MPHDSTPFSYVRVLAPRRSPLACPCRVTPPTPPSPVGTYNGLHGQSIVLKNTNATGWQDESES